MSAFEELKAWCDKHLNVDEYKIIPESPSYYATIYIEPDDNASIPCFIFDEQGNFVHSDTCTNEEMCEHIRDLEEN